MLTFIGKNPIQQVKRFCKKERKPVEINQPNNINVYNQSMGGVDRMDQNIAAYMINLCSKKWWWSLFRFVVDVFVNNALQLYRLRNLNVSETKLDLLGFRRAIVGCIRSPFQKRNT